MGVDGLTWPVWRASTGCLADFADGEAGSVFAASLPLPFHNQRLQTIMSEHTPPAERKVA